MATMYCPQCGRELEFDSEVRFCRYCGFSLTDTKETLQGFSEVNGLSVHMNLAIFDVKSFEPRSGMKSCDRFRRLASFCRTKASGSRNRSG
jgi:hypothetical protein